MKGSLTKVCGIDMQIQGKVIRIARISEGYDFVDDPNAMIAALRELGTRIDLLTFIQRLAEASPLYRYPLEWDNLAAVPITTFDHWFTKQIKGKTRNMLRKAEKMGAEVKEVPFDDALIAGIAAINNESPVRQGTRYWHYGDSLETVRMKTETFLERTVFLGVFFEGALIGYAKLVSEEGGRQAGLMQILSMLKHRDKAPNNLMISQAVRSCAQRGIPFLWYSHFSFGKKEQDTLSDFKQNNGFQRIELPRYYVPLTALGRFALQFRLHHGIKQHLPSTLLDCARKVRHLWLAHRLESARGRF